jgi:tRNA(Ile)-lysidine synthetase-like protein
MYRFLSENGVTNIADVHIDAVLRLCSERVLHSRIELPCLKSAVIGKTHLSICDTSDFSKNKISFDKEFRYGINLIEETGDTLARFYSDDLENIGNFKNIYKNFIQTDITSDKIVNVLRFRTREPGDTVNINGVNRKLKKLLWEITDDRSERERLPVIYDDNGILWIPGARSRTGSFPKNGETYQLFFYVKSTDTQERINNNEK